MSSEGIAELVDEEEKNSDVGDEMIDDEETKEIMQTIRTNQKRNLLCKNLLDQTKELCYSHSPVYKDFDIMFQKVLSRLALWEMFEDDDML